jgi:hypothetical protein|tara:strand:- start:347 stop:547 length:201 start_codon:yes stop_codon:yes gene_type:complete
MAIISKRSIKIVEGKAYVHPLTIPELEFLLKMVAEAGHKLEDIPKVLEITKKLQSEYKLIKEHSNE